MENSVVLGCFKNEGQKPEPPLSSVESGEDENENYSALKLFKNVNESNGSTEEDEPFSVWSQILASVSAIMFYPIIGFSMGFSAILIPQLQQSDSHIQVDHHDFSWITSVMSLSFAAVAVGVGYLSDGVGRLTTLKLSVIPHVLGWTCIAMATNVPLIIVGRAVTGVAKAMQGFPALDYTAEVVQKDLRGTMSCIACSLPGVGMVAVYALGGWLHWRTVAWVAALSTAVPLTLVSVFATESPPWLMSKGRNNEANNSLQFILRAKSRPIKTELTHLKKKQMLKEMEGSKSHILEVVAFLSTPNGFRPFALLFVLLLIQEFSGCYIVVFYAVPMFQAMGTTMDPYVCSMGVGAIKVTFGHVTAYLMRHFGRRPMLVLSSLGMTASMLAAGHFTVKIAQDGTRPASAPAVCLLLYFTFSICGLLTIPWTLVGEFYPQAVRGRLHGLSSLVGHLLMSAALKAYPFMPELVGGLHRVFWLFAGVSFAAAIFVYVFVPETHNKTLEEIQDYFQHNTVYLKRKKDDIKGQGRIV